MNKRITLNWQHDLDLIGLNVHPDFELGKMMKRAIIACAKGDTGFRIPLPRPMPYPANCNNMQVNIAFTPGVDDEVIQFINGFRYGYQVNAMKQIFRMYLEGPYLEPYYNEKMFNVKARGKKRPHAIHGVIPVAGETVSKRFTRTVAPASLPQSYVSKGTQDVEIPKNEVKEKNAPLTVPLAENKSAIQPAMLKTEPVVVPEPKPVIEEQKELVEDVQSVMADADSSEDGFDLFGAINDMMN